MSFGDAMGRAKEGVLRVLDLAARPVRTAQGGSAGDETHRIVLQPYRGYGSDQEVFLIGRVFRQSRRGRRTSPSRLGRHLRDIGRRIARRPVAGVTLTARFCDAKAQAVTDRDGYFRIHLRPRHGPPADRLWHRMDLALAGPAAVQAQADVFVPSRTCRYVVISDIDDTVMYTGVANKIEMLWRLFVQHAHSRVAFPGVAAFYRALHAGASGDQNNPMLYVSRGPWGLYDILDEFFAIHRIPVGPILFLREWGISWKSPLPRRAEDHKRELIGNMLSLYRDLPFVLIGDSGQHDPEVYRTIVEAHPGRVLAVYIRNVSRDPARMREIEEMVVRVVEAGSGMLLAADSVAMAEHAAGLGLVGPETVAAVRREIAAEPDATARLHPTRRIGRPTRRQTEEAVDRGALKQAVDQGGDDTPPNVVVEPEDRRRP